MVRFQAGGPREEGALMKKGPWTPEEDQKLIAFIQEHGHGNWRVLPKRSGLQRCGKSCRLRWTNYLRPDIKRGQFTEGERQKIIQLHALVGNKWAFIASQLPNRTDNEIKNYWNTVLRKAVMTPTPTPTPTASLATDPATMLTIVQGQSLIMQRPTNDGAAAAEVYNNSYRNIPSKIISNCSGSTGGGSSSSTSNSYSTARGQLASTAHLAQWESVRLQAEARLLAAAAAAPISTFRCSLFSRRPAPTAITAAHNIPAASIPSCYTSTTPIPASLIPCSSIPPPNIRPTFPSHASQPSTFIDTLPPLIHTHPPYPPAHHKNNTLISTQHNSPSIVISPTSLPINSFKPNPDLISSQASLKPLAALTLGPDGQLSWKAQELAFKDIPSCNVARGPPRQLENKRHKSDQGMQPLDHHLHQAALREKPRAITLEEATTSMDLNSMNSLSSSYSWDDLLFGPVENGYFSEVVSSNSGECSSYFGKLCEPKSSQESHDSQCKKASSLMTNCESIGIEGSTAHVIGSHFKRDLAHECNLMPFQSFDGEKIGYMTDKDVEILASIMG